MLFALIFIMLRCYCTFYNILNILRFMKGNI
nr:MAG TPA: hypothetical protein [Caudoviricetes sp.]